MDTMRAVLMAVQKVYKTVASTADEKVSYSVLMLVPMMVGQSAGLMDKSKAEKMVDSTGLSLAEMRVGMRVDWMVGR